MFSLFISFLRYAPGYYDYYYNFIISFIFFLFKYCFRQDNVYEEQKNKIKTTRQKK